MASNAAEIFAAIEADAREHEAGLDAENAQLANDAAEYARGIAPVGAEGVGDPHPGRFRDSIGVRGMEADNGLPARQVYSDDETASYKEFGTARTPKHATFARTAEHFKIYRPQIEGG